MSAPEISTFLESRVAAGDFPGYAFRVARGETPLAEGYGGLAMREPREIPVAADTIWDVASLTKPFVTAPLAAALCAAGLFTLDESLRGIFPDLPDDKAALTLSLLLTHTAGLPAWAPVYLFAKDKAALYEFLCGVEFVHPPGTAILYSDLGYLLAGLVVERLAGQGLNDLFDQHFARPLNLRDSGFVPAFIARRRIAASEAGNAHEAEMIAGNPLWTARAAEHPASHELLWGEVHDGNARALGGVAGHAGLFGTVAELNRLAAHLVTSSSRALWLSPRADDGKNRRTLSCVLQSTADSAGHAILPGTAIGHAGFTGVSWHYDPARDRHYFLMTNRTHPHPSKADMQAVRREFLRLASALPDDRRPGASA